MGDPRGGTRTYHGFWRAYSLEGMSHPHPRSLISPTCHTCGPALPPAAFCGRPRATHGKPRRTPLSAPRRGANPRFATKAWSRRRHWPRPLEPPPTCRAAAGGTPRRRQKRGAAAIGPLRPGAKGRRTGKEILQWELVATWHFLRQVTHPQIHTSMPQPPSSIFKATSKQAPYN